MAPVAEYTKEVPGPAGPAPPSAAPSPDARSTSPGALAPPEAERRQLTVLFCDLVDSTMLAGSSTRKTCARWCGPTSRPVPR